MPTATIHDIEQCIENCTRCHRICLETTARHLRGEGGAAPGHADPRPPAPGLCRDLPDQRQLHGARIRAARTHLRGVRRGLRALRRGMRQAGRGSAHGRLRRDLPGLRPDLPGDGRGYPLTDATSASSRSHPSGVSRSREPDTVAQPEAVQRPLVSAGTRSAAVRRRCEGRGRAPPAGSRADSGVPRLRPPEPLAPAGARTPPIPAGSIAAGRPSRCGPRAPARCTAPAASTPSCDGPAGRPGRSSTPRSARSPPLELLMRRQELGGVTFVVHRSDRPRAAHRASGVRASMVRP